MNPEQQRMTGDSLIPDALGVASSGGVEAALSSGNCPVFHRPSGPRNATPRMRREELHGVNAVPASRDSIEAL